MTAEAALYLTANHLIGRWARQGHSTSVGGEDHDEIAVWIHKGIKEDFKRVSSSLPAHMVTKKEIVTALHQLERYGLIVSDVTLNLQNGYKTKIYMASPEQQRSQGSNLVSWFIDTYVKNPRVPNELVHVFNDNTISTVYEPWYYPYCYVWAHLQH